MPPAELRFLKTHEWALADGDIVTVGISDFAVTQLTDLVYIELPQVGTSLAAGAEFGVVESVKAASDLYSPVSGEVVEVHSELEEKPEILSNDAYGDGWIIKIKANDLSEMDGLLDSAAYEKHCEAEAH